MAESKDRFIKALAEGKSGLAGYLNKNIEE
jgi:hypothetical protein